MKTAFQIGRAIALSVFGLAIASFLIPSMRGLRFPLWALVAIVSFAFWYIGHTITKPHSTKDSWFDVKKTFLSESGQDVAEYAVILAVILVLVVGTIKLIGTNANNTFSSVASSIAPQ